MVKSSYQSTYKTREYLRPKLAKYPKIHSFSISIERFYSNITGFAHVLPDFFIIGVQKGGTSSLYDYLVQHTCVHPCVTKEPRFFDKYYNRGINWYKSCFPNLFSKNFETNFFHRKFLTGEATERYFEHPHVPKRIKKTIPNPKFIILLRNPIDRAFSHYNMRFQSNVEDLSFEKAIELEQNRTKGEFEKMLQDENYYSRDYFHHSYLERGIYVTKLKRWMNNFSKEQFLILNSEKFFKDPNLIYNQVLKFLELDPFELQIYKKIGASTYKHPKLETKLRKELSEFFKPYNEELFKFLGLKFDWD